MTVTAAPGSTLVDALTGERHAVDTDGTMTLRVEPHGAFILVPETDYVAL